MLMFGRIQRKFINELLSRVNIIDLINMRMQLKKQGKNFHAFCPFHHEKTASFTVNREKQFFYCFGCGAHGNAIDFLMKYDGLKFTESIEELAILYNMKVSYENETNHYQQYKYDKHRLYHIMEKLKEYYQHTLLIAPETTWVRRYLQQRGLNSEVIKSFSIGFAPTGWSNIINNFCVSEEDKLLLNHVGMLAKNKNGYLYDRFRQRLMFPMRDRRGRVIAFGGRVLGEGKPKYLNSPENNIFYKGRQLYGLYEACRHYSKLPRVLVVEGYMDVVSLSQFGIHYAVALLGTTNTDEQMKQLYCVTDHIIYCYDGDPAGKQAAWRALKNILPYLHDGRQIGFMFLPEGEDPDTLIRNIGKYKFEHHVDQAKPLSTFLFETLLSKIDISKLDGRVKLSSLALQLIGKIPGKTFRIFLRHQLGQKVGILDESQLERLIPKAIVNKKMSFLTPMKCTIMRILMGLLIQNPQLSTLISSSSLKELEQANFPGIPIFIELVHTCLFYPGLTTAQLLEYYREHKLFSKMKQLAIWNHMIIDEMIETTFVDILKKIYDSLLENRQDSLIAKERIQGLTYDERRELWSLNKTLAKG